MLPNAVKVDSVALVNKSMRLFQFSKIYCNFDTMIRLGGRVVKAIDLKSIGLCPRRFDSCPNRFCIHIDAVS